MAILSCGHIESTTHLCSSTTAPRQNVLENCGSSGTVARQSYEVVLCCGTVMKQSWTCTTFAQQFFVCLQCCATVLQHRTTNIMLWVPTYHYVYFLSHVGHTMLHDCRMTVVGALRQCPTVTWHSTTSYDCFATVADDPRFAKTFCRRAA